MENRLCMNVSVERLKWYQAKMIQIRLDLFSWHKPWRIAINLTEKFVAMVESMMNAQKATTETRPTNQAF